MLDSDAPGHWALTVLKKHGDVRPLDTLDASEGAMPLPPDALLVLAQPYPFSPQEYVALDDWVRAGGRVLLFADPMLTFESVYAIGDRRRPQDIVKLGPILTRWGLIMEAPGDEEAGERSVGAGALEFPVNLPGRFVPAQQSACTVEAGGLVADCSIGKGRVLAIADAALFDSERDSDGDSRRKALSHLLERLSEAP